MNEFDKRTLSIIFTKTGSDSIGTRLVLPISWIKALGITESEKEVEVYLDTTSNKIIIEKLKKQELINGKKTYFIVYSKNEFFIGKWNDGSVTLGFPTNPKAKLIEPGDEIILYEKKATLRGVYKVLPKEQWKKIKEEDFETDYQKNNGYTFKSETQFTIKPIIELTKPIDFRLFLNQLLFTKNLGKNWNGSIQGHNGIKILLDNDINILKNAIKIAKEEEEEI